MEDKKILKEEKKKVKKENKKKVDKTRIITKIIALLMVIFMVMGVAASFIYYMVRMFR